MLILAVESSCDETSVAVLDGCRVIANVVSSQIKLHAEYGGVVPELASREHLRQFRIVADEALRLAALKPSALEVVAATVGPGLPNALMTGAGAAHAFAIARGLHFVPVHHHVGHLYSPWLVGDPPRLDITAFEPHIGLIVSGGHTMLVKVPAWLDHKVLGGTIDDAAGECFDKVAKLIGLPYPGGVYLDQLAEGGNPEAIQFPRPMLDRDGFEMSFSGLKTAFRYYIRDHDAQVQSEQGLRDLCASVRRAIVDILTVKSMDALRKTGYRMLTLSGGVAANRELRATLERECFRTGAKLLLAQRKFCGDNAAIIGAVAFIQIQTLGFQPAKFPYHVEIRPRWALGALT